MVDSTQIGRPKGPADIALATVQALRPKQWIKNVFLFAAILFSMNYLRVDMWVQTLVGFASFSLAASTGYLLNDYRDREADRRHPTKCRRPIASGRLPLGLAIVEMVLAASASLALAAWLGGWFTVVVLFYFATTVTYSLYFKHKVILDVMFLAACYVWRAVAGAVAIDVSISAWLLVCTMFVAMFLGFNKRRGELELLSGEAGSTRKILEEYSSELVVEFQAITTSGTIISYALYCVLASPTPWLLLTMPMVLYAVFRYMYLVSRKREGSAPDETLLKDGPILATCALYGVTVLAVLVLGAPSA